MAKTRRQEKQSKTSNSTALVPANFFKVSNVWEKAKALSTKRKIEVAGSLVGSAVYSLASVITNQNQYPLGLFNTPAIGAISSGVATGVVVGAVEGAAAVNNRYNLTGKAADLTGKVGTSVANGAAVVNSHYALTDRLSAPSIANAKALANQVGADAVTVYTKSLGFSKDALYVLAMGLAKTAPAEDTQPTKKAEAVVKKPTTKAASTSAKAILLAKNAKNKVASEQKQQKQQPKKKEVAPTPRRSPRH